MTIRHSVRKSASILGVCLGIALLMPALPEASLTALNTNQTIFQPGDTFVLTLILGKEGFTSGDLYVQVMLPNGTILFLNETGQFTAIARPFRANLTIAVPSQTEIFSGSFPFALQGTYTLQAFQVLTGSDPTNPDNLIGTGFPVRIAFVAPTSPVGTNITIPLGRNSAAIDVNAVAKTAILLGIPSSMLTVSLVTKNIISLGNYPREEYPLRGYFP